MNSGILIRLLLSLVLLLPLPLDAGQGITEDYASVVAEIIEQGDRALDNYTPAQSLPTGNLFSRLYFDVFEGSGMEFTLGLKDQALTPRIESGFSRLISLAMRGGDKAALQAAWTVLKADLRQASIRYPGTGRAMTFWGALLQSFLVLFREGVEAMLVVAALTAYLRRSGYADKTRVIWHGVGWALLASVAGAWLFSSAIRASGARREILEGGAMLLAAAVLIYVCHWLLARREAERWQAFIRERMDRAISRGSLFALGSVAFLAVFREGAETILFYQALIGAADDLAAVWTGMGLAGLALLLVYLAIRFASVRLPLGLFFSATAVLLFAMAVIFAGKGLLEMQVGGLVPATPVTGLPVVAWLGLFPTWETLLGQAVVLLLLPIGWLWMKRNEQRPGREEVGA